MNTHIYVLVKTRSSCYGCTYIAYVCASSKQTKSSPVYTVFFVSFILRIPFFVVMDVNASGLVIRNAKLFTKILKPELFLRVYFWIHIFWMLSTRYSESSQLAKNKIYNSCWSHFPIMYVWLCGYTSRSVA